MTTFLKSHRINETTPFHDGQPHIAIPFNSSHETAFSEFNSTADRDLAITCRITSPDDLVRVAMLNEIIKSRGKRLRLKVLYLMGGRMDRRLSDREPYTLKAVCDLLNSMGLESVSAFCPHSPSTRDLLDAYDEYYRWPEDDFFDLSIINAAAAVYDGLKDIPRDEVKPLVRKGRMSFVFPDAGACKRFSKSKIHEWYPYSNVVVMNKHRDERTGIICETHIASGRPSKTCFIIDDLCDGGATFVKSAEVLRNCGADEVVLVVCHGIFSKGLPLRGIDYVCTTNSYQEYDTECLLGGQNVLTPDYVWRFA